MNLILVLALLSPMMQDKQGKLDKFTETLKDDPSSKKPKSKNQEESTKSPKYTTDDNCDHRASDFWGEIMGDVFGSFLKFTFLYPFPDHELRFDRYPWANGPLYFRSIDTDSQAIAFEADLTFCRVDSDLSSTGFRGVVRTWSGFDLTIDISQYIEDVGASRDRLTLQEYQFNYGPGDGGRNFQWSVGWGLAWLATEDFSDSGLSLQAKFVCLLSSPFSVEVSAAVMGFSAATINDLRAEFKVHINALAITVGIRSLINSRGDDLTGPTLGMSVYF